jgi:thiamine kinase-like enzyme
VKHNIKKTGGNFRIPGDFICAGPYGSGHINDTYCAIYNQGGKNVRYIFQRINHNVFKNPPALMENIERVTEHQHSKMLEEKSSRRALRLIRAQNGYPYYRDEQGLYWRVYIFIENAKTYDVIEKPEQAFEAAAAFGEFQRTLVDLKGGRLIETIPDFHNTPARYEKLKDAVEKDAFNRAADVKKEIDFAMARESCAGTLIDLHEKGEIPERITHNDTKLNNVMIDDKTGEGICVIDLDTVMPGLVHYDFGDLVRTSTSPVAEDEKDLSRVRMQPHMFEALIKGYLKTADGFLTGIEKEYLPFSGKLITLEIGVRFLTDYLMGDVYFKIHREGHNIDRCRTQFKLVSSIEENEETMMSFIK